MNRTLLATACLLGLLGATPQDWKPTKSWLDDQHFLYWQPRHGYVQTKDTALAIANAVAKEQLGAKALKDYGRLDAVRIDDMWIIYSQPPVDEKGHLAAGGKLIVQISKANGAVLNISAGQ